MKKYIFISVLFIIFIHCINAQTQYHSDTLFNNYRNEVIVNTIKTNTGFANTILSAGTGHFSIIYTDNDLHQTRYKEWNVFDTLRFQHNTGGLATLPNKNHIIVGTTWKNGLLYGAIIEMDSTMQDTVRTKKIQIQHNNTNYVAAFYEVAIDSYGYIWVGGAINTPIYTSSCSLLLKLDANYNIIGQYVFDFPGHSNNAFLPVPTPDGGCLTKGWIRDDSGSCGTYQVFAIKVDSNCNRLWYREYGNTNMPDANGTLLLFPSIYANKYWFIYNEGQRVRDDDPFCDEPYVRFKAVLLDEQGNEYLTKYMTDTLRFTWSVCNVQLPDKSIVMSIYRRVQYDDDVNVMNFSSLYKFSPTMDSVWRKLIVPPRHFPFSYERNQITTILQDTNGDFVCGGIYEGFDASYPEVWTPWVARIDSTGCGEQACAVVPTEASPAHSRGGENVRVFPNPTTGNLQLAHQNGIALKSYSISDISGRMVAENASIPNDNTLRLDVPNGVYFLFVNDAEGVVSKHKVMVIR